MLKTLITILLVSTIMFAQSKENSNPDGDRVSVHLTPFFVSGYNEVSAEGNTETNNFISEFNLKLLIKMPLSNNITIAPFATTDNFSYEKEITTGRFPVTGKFSYFFTKVGATLSFYF